MTLKFCSLLMSWCLIWYINMYDKLKNHLRLKLAAGGQTPRLCQFCDELGYQGRLTAQRF